MLETFKAILFSAIAITSINIPNYTYIAKNPYLPATLTASTLEVTNIQHAEKTISEKIITYSKEYDIDVLLALNVACAESCTHDEENNIIFNPTAKNPKSTASGVFQFIQSTWNSMCKGDVFNEDDNIKCAVKILATEKGIKHWEASRKDGFGGGWENQPYEKFKVIN